MTLIDTDPDGLAEELIRTYLHQILIDGFFHADPHPGNVFITDSGQIALIDLGMVGHLSPSIQEKLLKLVLAISEGRGEEAADAAIALGEMREEFDETAFKHDVVGVVGHYYGAALEDFQVGKIVLEVNRSAGTHGIKSPVELTMLGKTLLNLDHIARISRFPHTALPGRRRPGTLARGEHRHARPCAKTPPVDNSLFIFLEVGSERRCDPFLPRFF